MSKVYIDCTVSGIDFICDRQKIPAGNELVLALRARFSEEWANLSRFAVFAAKTDDGDVTGEILINGIETDISEMFADAHYVEFGFIGADSDGNIVKSTGVKSVYKTKGAYIVNPGVRADAFSIIGRVRRLEEKVENLIENGGTGGGGITNETDPTVPAWAKKPTKPTYEASEVGADPKGTATSEVSKHNTSEKSHNDIRLLIEGLSSRLNAVADSDDTTLDQLSEIVAYIKSNKSLIESITTSKVNVSDIIDNLTTSVSNKPLSAKQGAELKKLINDIPKGMSEEKIKALLEGRLKYNDIYEEEINNFSLISQASCLDVSLYNSAGTEHAPFFFAMIFTAMTDDAYTGTTTGYIQYAIDLGTGKTYLRGVIEGVTPTSADWEETSTSVDLTAIDKAISNANAAAYAAADAAQSANDAAEYANDKASGADNIARAMAEKIGEINTMLENGEFNGKDGTRGTGILNITGGLASYTATVNGSTSAYRILLSRVKTDSKVNDVLVGDTIRYSTFLYPIIYVDDTYAYCSARVTIQGTAGTSVTVKSVTESTESGGSNVVTFSDGKTLTVKNGKDGQDGTITLPDYWESYLPDKINAIKALQKAGGKDCFSYIVMADMHYTSNLGKRSPAIAKRLMDELDIKYALALGDFQARGCWATKEQLESENVLIEEMFLPIKKLALRTEGNHDGSYGYKDRDGNGEYNNTDSEGKLKPENERETYVNNLTPAELHSYIYRKVGMVGDAHFDESGTGYYIDDVSNKVRYIILNTQCNQYELQEDGTSKYPKMWLFRFTQSQFDLVIEALKTMPSDSWNVVVTGHCPLWQEIGDREVMKGVLSAYKARGTFTGEYAGTSSGKAYTNLAEPLPNNKTDTTKWVTDYRISSSGVSAQTGKTVCNPISVKIGDVIRVKGVSFASSVDRVQLGGTRVSDGTALAHRTYVSALPDTAFGYKLNDDGVHEFTVLETVTSTGLTSETLEFRCAFNTPTNPNDIIITVNEPIVEGATKGYDYVYVDVDFTEAKGNLIGYFAGHIHYDHMAVQNGIDGTQSKYNFPCITTRCDAKEENTAELKNERVAGTITEQSFDVFTVNTAERKIYATKIGAGDDRVITY